jgi:two-component system LytT family response regulator
MRVISIPTENRSLHPLGQNTLTQKTSAVNPNRKIALPTMEGIHFERIQNIICLEAKGNYTHIHFSDRKKILVCKTLQDVENILNDRLQFVRIHRSHTINLNHLQKYFKGKGGYVMMDDGTCINVSAGKKQQFMESLQIYFS